MTLTYDEAVHTYIGASLIFVAAVGAFFVDRPGTPAWRHHTWLVLGLMLAWIVMGSNESWTPPTTGNVWWTPVQHLLTMSGPKSWFSALSSVHVLQHKLSALCIVTPAVTEWFVRTRPTHPASRYLRFVLPVTMAAIGVIFVVHRPTHRHMHGMAPDPAAIQAELYQHWVFAAAFFGAALTSLLARIPFPTLRFPPRAWYAFMALGGLVFVTFRV